MNRHTAIFDALRREILAGKFDGADRLPSESQLARRFGVSRPTVSRVMLDLKRDGLIVTRAGAVARLSRFAQNATGAFAVINPGRGYGGVLSEICEHLVRLGEQVGWEMARAELMEVRPEKRAREIVRWIHQFADERVSGLFLQSFEYLLDDTRARRDVLGELTRCGLPTVLLDYDIVPAPERSNYDLVGIDNMAAGLAVGRSLLSRGFQRLAFLMKHGSPPTVVARMRGVACAVIEAGGRWMPSANVLAADPDNRADVAAFLRTYRPQAVVCGNDVLAARLHATLEHLSKAGDVHLAGFDNLALAEQLGLTSVAQPCADIATIALSTMQSRLAAPRLPVRTILLNGTLVAR